MLIFVYLFYIGFSVVQLILYFFCYFLRFFSKVYNVLKQCSFARRFFFEPHKAHLLSALRASILICGAVFSFLALHIFLFSSIVCRMLIFYKILKYMLHFYTMLELCTCKVEIWRLVFMLFCFSLYGSFDHLWTMVTLATVKGHH